MYVIKSIQSGTQGHTGRYSETYCSGRWGRHLTCFCQFLTVYSAQPDWLKSTFLTLLKRHNASQFDDCRMIIN